MFSVLIKHNAVLPQNVSAASAAVDAPIRPVFKGPQAIWVRTASGRCRLTWYRGPEILS